ncbi:hypothetical protein [Buttiauxella warmboldiae]|uniref:hypothetical protein n=1 Tax=Buttiauxella warmboldiae TaxID=82993 RepID=UPI00142E8308|nr:hypothetical protein [Buttiauxella warmboldiae]
MRLLMPSVKYFFGAYPLMMISCQRYPGNTENHHQAQQNTLWVKMHHRLAY